MGAFLDDGIQAVENFLVSSCQVLSDSGGLHRFRIVIPATILLVLASCTSESPDQLTRGTRPANASPWEGTVEEESDGRHVARTTGGAVWIGGSRDLILQHTIGEREGRDDYLLGRIRALALHEDFVFALDEQPGTVRVYDVASGVFVRTIGGPGPGPGEFLVPSGLRVSPTGTIGVREFARVHLFDKNGQHLFTTTLNSNSYAAHSIGFNDDGSAVYAPKLARLASGDGRVELALVQANSAETVMNVPQMGGDRPTVSVPERPGFSMMIMNVPYGRRVAWTIGQDGTVAAGDSSEYRIELRGPAGSVREVVRSANAIGVPDDERRWATDWTISRARRAMPDWEWNGPPVPDQMPFFERLHLDGEDRLWVWRALMPSVFEPQCRNAAGETAGPCWKRRMGWDVFGPDGRYLGIVLPPEDLVVTTPLAASGEDVILYLEDDSGVGRIGVYKLGASRHSRP